MKEKRAVVGLVELDGYVLMGKKKSGADGFLAGLWHVPGETLEGGEEDYDGVVRGIREETGLEVEVIEYMGTHITPKHTEVNWYRCLAHSGDIKAGSDFVKSRNLEIVYKVPRGEIYVFKLKRTS